MKDLIKKFIKKLQKPTVDGIDINRPINTQIQKSLNDLYIQDFLYHHLYDNNKYLNNKKLNIFEYQVYSQYGEDGIINEIFSRLQITEGYFVEFGVETGLECNTTNLLINNWIGLWIEGCEASFNQITNIFQNEIESNRLKVINKYVTKDNIERLLKESEVPTDFDILSIDIDYNDYHIWDSIKSFKPKVVVIEYNAVLRPPTEYVVKYNEDGNHGIFTSHFGASLYSLELLAKEKGYSLVGCSFSGVNAFFIRDDFLDNKFEGPFTALNHYEPPRYFLYHKLGHKRGWGEFHSGKNKGQK